MQCIRSSFTTKQNRRRPRTTANETKQNVEGKTNTTKQNHRRPRATANETKQNVGGKTATIRGCYRLIFQYGYVRWHITGPAQKTLPAQKWDELTS